MTEAWDQPLIYDRPVKCGNMLCVQTADPTLKDLQLAMWRNILIFAIFVVSIISLFTTGGVAYGLAMNAPMLEKTSMATLGMRNDTKGLIDSGTKKFNDLMAEYPPNQMNIWLARADSTTQSVDTILASVAATTKGKAVDVGGIAATAIKGVMAEFVTEETKQKLNQKLTQLVDALDPQEIANAVKNFNKLMNTVEEKQVIDHADALLKDVDKSVRDFQSGRKITLEAKM